MKYIILIYLSLFGFLSNAQSLESYADSFEQTGIVNDYIDILTIQEENLLIQQVDSIEKLTGIEYAICLIDSLNGHAARDLATAIGNNWQIGKSGYNNGVLILISEQDKEIFIATGLGTEKFLPDDKVKEIVDNYSIPNLKKKEYFVALSLSILKLQEQLNSTALVSSNNPSSVNYLLLIIIIGIIAYVIYDYYKLGGFDPETRKYIRQRSNSGMIGGADGGSSGGGSFDGGGAGGSFGGDSDGGD